MDMYNLNRPRLVEILARQAQDLGVAIKYGREVNSAGEFPEANLVVAADGAGSRVPPNNCLAALEGLFKEQLEGHHLIGRISDEMDIRWLSSRSVANRRWHDGKVVPLGDSAHAPNFTAGLGTTLALEGAITLANNVHQSNDPEISLQQYERECRDSMRKSWDQAARSGQWFSSIARYIDFKPRQFITLIHARRSALLPLVPPRMYYAARQLRRRITP